MAMELSPKKMLELLIDEDDFDDLGAWVKATTEEAQYPNTIPEPVKQFVDLYTHWKNGNID